MEFLIPSFLAGVLTVLAPCVIALLPVILGGTLGQKNPWRPLVIAVSLGISVMIFSLLLKATAVLLGVPQQFWQIAAGALILAFGLSMTFPSVWEAVSLKLKLHKSENLLVKSNKKEGLGGAVLLGASLGPVFTTCSPTYAVILAIILPANLFVGLINLLAYSLGLMTFLLLIGYGGQKVSSKFRFAANPRGWFKKGLGILLVLTGLMIVTGLDKEFETLILNSGYLGPIQIEQSIIDKAQDNGSF